MDVIANFLIDLGNIESSGGDCGNRLQ